MPLTCPERRLITHLDSSRVSQEMTFPAVAMSPRGMVAPTVNGDPRSGLPTAARIQPISDIFLAGEGSPASDAWSSSDNPTGASLETQTLSNAVGPSGFSPFARGIFQHASTDSPLPPSPQQRQHRHPCNRGWQDPYLNSDTGGGPPDSGHGLSSDVWSREDLTPASAQQRTPAPPYTSAEGANGGQLYSYQPGSHHKNRPSFKTGHGSGSRVETSSINDAPAEESFNSQESHTNRTERGPSSRDDLMTQARASNFMTSSGVTRNTVIGGRGESGEYQGHQSPPSRQHHLIQPRPRRGGLGRGTMDRIGGSRASREQHVKTKMCPFLDTPHGCFNANECLFAHSVEELRERPDLTKTKLCVAFASGSCDLGDRCTYAHGAKELRSTPYLFKTDLCKYWAQGSCQCGDLCRHAHGTQDLKGDHPRRGEVTAGIQALPAPRAARHTNTQTDGNRSNSSNRSGSVCPNTSASTEDTYGNPSPKAAWKFGESWGVNGDVKQRNNVYQSPAVSLNRNPSSRLLGASNPSPHQGRIQVSPKNHGQVRCPIPHPGGANNTARNPLIEDIQFPPSPNHSASNYRHPDRHPDRDYCHPGAYSTPGENGRVLADDPFDVADRDVAATKNTDNLAQAHFSQAVMTNEGVIDATGAVLAGVQIGSNHIASTGSRTPRLPPFNTLSTHGPVLEPQIPLGGFFMTPAGTPATLVAMSPLKGQPLQFFAALPADPPSGAPMVLVYPPPLVSSSVIGAPTGFPTRTSGSEEPSIVDGVTFPALPPASALPMATISAPTTGDVPLMPVMSRGAIVTGTSTAMVAGTSIAVNALDLNVRSETDATDLL